MAKKYVWKREPYLNWLLWEMGYLYVLVGWADAFLFPWIMSMSVFVTQLIYSYGAERVEFHLVIRKSS